MSSVNDYRRDNEAFFQLLFLELVVVSEENFLQVCPFYTEVRKSLPKTALYQHHNLLLLLKDTASTLALLGARFVSKLFRKGDLKKE